jgi:hypothetical protein
MNCRPYRSCRIIARLASWIIEQLAGRARSSSNPEVRGSNLFGRATSEYAIDARRCRFCASNPARFWEHGVARLSEVRTQELQRLCPFYADWVQEGRQEDGSRSDVLMSGVPESGRESGHGNIDASEPKLMETHRAPHTTYERDAASRVT